MTDDKHKSGGSYLVRCGESGSSYLKADGLSHVDKRIAPRLDRKAAERAKQAHDADVRAHGHDGPLAVVEAE